MEWLAASAYDAIVPATPKIADRFPAVKTVTVQNFPIVGGMLCPVSTSYAERAAAFGYVGVITAERGAFEMVRAMEALGDVPNARLDVAGEFSPASLEDELRALPGWAAVNYHGQVPMRRVAELLGGVRAGVVLFHPLPNHVDAQPNKMFEYMSAGLPVIASDFPLWRQIIGGAECGLLVDPLDPEAIVQATRWILNHPAEAEAMGQRGRQAVEHTYNWGIEATKLLRLYGRLLSQ